MKLNIQLFADPKLTVYADLDTKSFKEGLNKMQSIAKVGFDGLAVLAKTTAAVITNVLGKAIDVLKQGVSFNAEIEQLQTSFEVMTGSAEKATEVIEKLKDVGAKTPYDLKGLAETTQLLMQYGFTADEAYEATINLGDIAQGSAEKMNSIALAFGQMSSLGKVTMQDIKQMINAGFNPLQAVAEMTGETMQEVTARYEAGEIAVEDITKAMQFASSEGGKYYQSMEKQSKTLNGQVSTLKDNFNSLAGTLSEGLSKTITNDVLPSINDLLQNMEKAFSDGGIPAMVDALGEGITNGLTKIVQNAPKFIEVGMMVLENLVRGFKENLPMIADSAVQIVMMLSNTILDMMPNILEIGILLLVELIKGIAQAIPELVPKVIEVITQICEVLLANLDQVLLAGVDILIAVIEGIIEAIPKLVEMLPRIINSIVVALTSPEMLMKIIYAGIEITLALIKGILQMIPQLALLPIQIILDLVAKFKEKIHEIKDVGKQLITGLWNGIKEKWENLKQKVADLGNGIISKFKSVFGIKSPSRRFRDEIGKQLSAGLGVGFEDELHNVYRNMQKAIDLEQGKLMANVESGSIFNSLQNSIPVVIDVNADVDLDGQKVGRMITPTITRTLKSGGA